MGNSHKIQLSQGKNNCPLSHIGIVFVCLRKLIAVNAIDFLLHEGNDFTRKGSRIWCTELVIPTHHEESGKCQREYLE